MRRILSDLWKDDCGALLASEWVLLATILLLGIIPGLVAVRNGLLKELNDEANAVMSLDQSYEFEGQEIVCSDGIRVFGGDALRQSAAHGSITDIFIDPSDHLRTVKGDGLAGHRGVGALQGPAFERPSTARTAGSAFLQGNHTADGNEVQSSVKRIESKRVGAETNNAMMTAPVD
jgi:hypothetical protein